MPPAMFRNALIKPAALFSLASFLGFTSCAAGAGLTLAREGNWLIIQGANIPDKEIRINYLEAYCRDDSTDADWVRHTVIPHTNQLVWLSPAWRIRGVRKRKSFIIKLGI
jgi:hypothetical protein